MNMADDRPVHLKERRMRDGYYATVLVEGEAPIKRSTGPCACSLCAKRREAAQEQR